MNTNIIEFEDRKPNANNVLANLPPADQDQIKDWLQNHSYTATVDKINAPRPEGLGLKIHYTSLRNYYLDQIQPENLVEQQADQDQIQDLSAVSTKIPYLNAVSNRLQKRLFDLSLNTEPPKKNRTPPPPSSPNRKPPTQTRPTRPPFPLGAPASLPASNPTPQAEIQTKTSPVANKEKQELSNFPNPKIASSPLK